MESRTNHGGNWQDVLFKRERMYRHNVMRINYTTYDVRREEEAIHPKTSHRDVMVLNSSYWDGDSNAHPFHYARILGIYHANVIYMGEGNRDYRSHRLEFLHVRWFEMDDTVLGGWSNLKLDRIRLRPVTEPRSFGFLDPADILRGSHLISAFSQRNLHINGIGGSRLARDDMDYDMYYVNRCACQHYIVSLIIYPCPSCYRFVDRDMTMRYLPGLGVGHTYAHNSSPDGILDGSIQDGVGESGEEEHLMTHDIDARDEHITGEVGEDQEPQEDEDNDEDNEDREEKGGDEDADSGGSEDEGDYLDDESLWSETEGSEDSEEY